MEIKEQHILRLTIEYPRGDRDAAFGYLDKRFGEYNYRITRSGPKMIETAVAHPTLSQMIVEVQEDILEQLIAHPHLKIHNTGRKGKYWPETAEEIRELL